MIGSLKHLKMEVTLIGTRMTGLLGGGEFGLHLGLIRFSSLKFGSLFTET